MSALKDKARYSAAANDLRTAYDTLVFARKIQPDDLSIPLDIAYIFLMTGDSVYKQRTCELLNESKSDIKAKLDTEVVFPTRNQFEGMLKFFLV